MKSYDHKKIEQKWQKQWAKDGAYKTDTNLSKPKYYVLDMFPYPSGAGLHVGHPKGYIASDIVARKKRQEGYRVLHPMGWDAFGLPAENYAIKTGTPPQQTTDESIKTFKSQISNLSLSYDWDREIGSHRPDYYRWTQWLFTKFFEKGLVYKKKALVNWDPVDQTVLANEQVLPDGTAERSGAVVEKKDLEQWFYKITDYADELADSLDAIDWPESTKVNQRNWIGRSEGAEIDFYLDFGDEAVNARTGPDGKRAHITVFTTRPDTLFGATYLVLAPEHVWVTLALGHKTVLENNDEVQEYVDAAKKKSDIDRQAADKEKTGVQLKGVLAVNPATGERIPMFTADYVLAHYGTGAIMAVPAHDERDMAFAQKYNLPIRQVVMPVFGPENKRPDAVFRNTVNAVVRNDEGKFLFLKWREYNWVSNVIGGVEQNETIERAAIREVLEETGYSARPIFIAPIAIESHYFADHKNEWRSRLDTPVLMELESDQKGPLSEEEREKHDTFWMTYEEASKAGLFHNNKLALDLALGKITAYTSADQGEEQVLVNSGEFNGMSVEEAKKAMTERFGRVKKTYKLRDWLISRQRYWGAPIPIVYDPEGKPHAIPEEHLPWLLPTDVEYMPKGTSPLGSSTELKERTERIFGIGWTPEIDTMDTFACSSWYFFRFADPHNDKEFTSAEALRDWLPVDLYIGGAEHTVLHLLYARFYTKGLRDMGYLNFDEPFLKLRHQGLIVAEDGRKMSKRYGNVINPDDIVESYGADTLRVYEMFMGPFQDSIAWNTQSMIGSRRFLEKVWRLAEKTGDTPDESLERLLHRTIKKVSEDIEAFKFNTAISTLMIFVNEAEKKSISKDQFGRFLQMLAPFAPHITEELWHEIGHVDSILKFPMPIYDEDMLMEETVTVAIQINGKMRGSVSLPMGTGQAETERAAAEAVSPRLDGKNVTRIIVVPNKLVNFVVSDE
jgi:leucyl-tRNA synthetase